MEIRQRHWRDFEKEIGDRVRFEVRGWDGEPKTIIGRITGRGAAGFYLEIQGDDGMKYSGQSSECEKLFDE